MLQDVCQPFTRLGGGREGAFPLLSSLPAAERHESCPQNCLSRLRVRTERIHHTNASNSETEEEAHRVSVLSIKDKPQSSERNTGAQQQEVEPCLNIYIRICLISQPNIYKDYTLLTQNKNARGNQPFKSSV